MDKKSFIKEEALSKVSGLVAINWRLFRSLPLFLKLLPFTLISIVLANVAPSVFRWYAGNYTSLSGNIFTLKGLSFVVILAALFRILAWLLFEVSGMWSSQRLHSFMIRGLAETRTTFFDENPSGRIMNRLIKDYDELRNTAIIFVGDFFNAWVELLSISAVAFFASPWATLTIIPLLCIFFFLHSQRSDMIEHCRSLAAVASSHVLNRKNDLIEGREVYRIYGRSEELLNRMISSLRSYLQASLLTMEVDIWASFWIRFFAEGFSFCVLLFTIYAIDSHRISISLAGVIISALFGVTGSIGWLDFASSLVSRSAPHLQRVFEFIDLPKEATEETAIDLKKTTLFPPQEILGDIVFENYSMSYRKELPLILQELNLTIPYKSKTAIVGRTGSGKSSLIQSLLRMVYVVQGDIKIGNHSIYSVDIKNLRRLFGVVPQFPYLFEGSLKLNLDRTGQIPGHNLKEALSEVGLKYSLDFKVAEGGLNLSLGERQLVCLARVIASHRPYVLMDEPTSGLDPLTDSRIHWVLHHALANKTVITIAHRKESLRGYDSVIEMSAGKAKMK